MTNDASTCAYERCDCALTGDLIFEHGGKRYCSERCYDRRGCDHHGCNCGQFPEPEPPPVD